MKLIYVVFFFASLKVNAQNNQLKIDNEDIVIKQDSTIAASININAAYNKHIDSAFGLKSDGDFELRLWERFGSYSNDNLFLLVYRDKAWYARYFISKPRKGGEMMFVEENILQTNLDKLWRNLKLNNLLTLPDANTLREKMITYVVDTINLDNGGHIKRMDMTDGVLYCFELKMHQNARFYNYGNPYMLQQQFGYIRELYQVVYNIMFIHRQIGKPLSVY